MCHELPWTHFIFPLKDDATVQKVVQKHPGPRMSCKESGHSADADLFKFRLEVLDKNLLESAVVKMY